MSAWHGAASGLRLTIGELARLLGRAATGAVRPLAMAEATGPASPGAVRPGATGRRIAPRPGGSIVRLPPRPPAKLPPHLRTGGGPRALLLQGPVGPFFGKLADALEAEGLGVDRVRFNSGDRLFSSPLRPAGRRVIDYREGRDAWAGWLRALMMRNEYRVVVMFGGERPAHAVAREVADSLGVPVVSLEEGYFRSGYVTVEARGNNARSPVARILPPGYRERPDDAGAAAEAGSPADATGTRETPAAEPVHEPGREPRHEPGREPAPRDPFASAPEPLEVRGGFYWMCWFGFLYFGMRNLWRRGLEKELDHKHRKSWSEVVYWWRNLGRWLADVARERLGAPERRRTRLLRALDGRFDLVPLQVSDDAQLGAWSSHGWTNRRLIEAAIESFARCAPRGRHLVFKIHPLERGHTRDHLLVRLFAREWGVGDRVHTIMGGPLSDATQAARGMIVINSTSGLSALAHAKPLLVLGRAIYRHPSLARCGTGSADIDAFWTDDFVADRELRIAYRNWLVRRCLVPGDFYAPHAMRATARNVARRAIALARAAAERASRPDAGERADIVRLPAPVRED